VSGPYETEREAADELTQAIAQAIHDRKLQHAVACCPVCFAMVVADKQRPYGDLTWAHEQWHARTDYPIPAAAAGKDGKE